MHCRRRFRPRLARCWALAAVPAIYSIRLAIFRNQPLRITCSERARATGAAFVNKKINVDRIKKVDSERNETQ